MLPGRLKSRSSRKDSFLYYFVLFILFFQEVETEFASKFLVRENPD